MTSRITAKLRVEEVLDAEGNACGWAVCLKIERTAWDQGFLRAMQNVRGMYPDQAVMIAVDHLPEGVQEFSLKDGIWFATNRNREEMFRRMCADLVRRNGSSHQGV